MKSLNEEKRSADCLDLPQSQSRRIFWLKQSKKLKTHSTIRHIELTECQLQLRPQHTVIAPFLKWGMPARYDGLGLCTNTVKFVKNRVEFE